MKILAVDTALGACSVALLDDDNVRAHIFEPMDRGHAERLAPMVEEAMKSAGAEFSALDRLAVTVGPGTFTGQRVGLAFMRGLRLALGLPLTGVTTLEAMAAAALAETGEPKAAAIHDARRDEAYLLLKQGETVVQQPVVMPFGDAVETIRAFGACALSGTGAQMAADSLGEGFAMSTICQPDALWVARLAARSPATQDTPGPLYLRAPDAKLPGGRSILQPKASAVRPSEICLHKVARFDATADTGTLAALHAACFSEAWDAPAIARLLATGAFAHHSPDGFVLTRVAGGEAEILTLAVLPQARGQGLGRALLHAAIAQSESLGAQSMFLEVGADNPHALALYAGLGFAKVGLRKAYYASGDALVLRLPLPAEFA
jgi:tRNA threonylcarbamoyladenosine biosynthesis protein TsaB